MRSTRLLLAFIGATVALAASAAGASAQTDRASERISPAIALATFDSAWQRVRNVHYDTTMRGVNWDHVRDELRPRAERARTVGELRSVLTEMVGRLGESHYGVIPQEAEEIFDPGPAGDPGAQPGDVGLSLRLLGADVVVSRVVRGGPADQAGVKPGWIVDSVGRYRARRSAERLSRMRTEAERRQALYRIPVSVTAAFAGAPGSVVTARFRDDTGRPLVKSLTRRPASGEVIRYPNLPPFVALVEHERLALTGAGAESCVGLIRFNIWMPQLLAQLDRAVDAVRDCRGVVLDLRGNPGGAGAMVMGVGGHFLDSAVALGTMRMRGNDLRYVANPRRTSSGGQPVRPYAGPLAILVDPLTGSTSEIFAAGLQSIGRARVFGETSAGQALPAMATRLPTGDVLLHVIADFVSPDGRRIEGRGVVPDETVPLRRADLRAGRDAAMEAAVRWLRDKH
jgi:carboxyl-terminal processing protease